MVECLTSLELERVRKDSVVAYLKYSQISQIFPEHETKYGI
jgi:hypothetical protein